MRSFIHERGCPASIVVHTFLPRFARAFLSLTSDRSCREISRFVTRALEREDSLDSRVLIGITSDVNEQSLASEGGRVSRCVSASVYFRSRFTAGRTRSSPLAFCPRRTRRRISSARDRERERERERERTGPRPCRDNSKLVRVCSRERSAAHVRRLPDPEKNRFNGSTRRGVSRTGRANAPVDP